MTQSSGGYLLYLLLYTVFWNALAAIAYRFFVIDGALAVQESLFFFMTGLLLIVSGAIRSMSPLIKSRINRCPIVGSFYLSGLLLIVYANLV